MARRVSLFVVLGAIAAARWANAAPLRADPQVEVIELAANGSGTGAVVLHNDTAATIAVGSITAEPGCDAAVQASPLGGFMLGAGATRTIAIACTPAPPSMQRCGYRVRSPGDAVLLAFEAVCAYAGSPALSPDLTTIDFGTVAVGGRASRTIVLRNTAAVPFAQLFVQTTDLAGNFAAAAPCNPDARECDAAIHAVAASGTTRLFATCTPRSAGPHSAQLHIATSAGTRLASPIALACTGAAATAPVLSAAPGAIDVGAVELVNATASATVHITNAGAGELRLLDVQIVDDGTGGAADWSYRALAPCSAEIPPSCVLAAGETVELELRFDPDAIAVRDATLLVNFHDTADRSTSIALRGRGRGPTLDLVGIQAPLDFGSLPLNVAGTLTFQVANRGTRELTGGAIMAMPAGPPFTVAPAASFAVTTSAPTTFTATCRPTTAGTFTTNLRLTAPDVQSAPIDLTLRCTGDPAALLTATPPAVQLGEVRLATPLVKQVAVAASGGGSISLASAALETPNPNLTVTGAPATTPAMIGLTATPLTEGTLANRIIVTAAPPGGPPLAVAITGQAVTATYSVPAAVSLGTFCVDQPTTPRILALTSVGSATIAAMRPALQSSDSPFDLDLVAPLAYPAALAPLQRALVSATPKRRTDAGLVTDDLIWSTDVASATTARTKLTATFVNNGGAIAPASINFGRTLIHLDTRNAQPVTLQNCDVSTLQLDPPQIPAPFSIDSPSLPSLLRPGETVTFSVGFHPTRLGPMSKTLVITSPQLRNVQLTVALSGEGVAEGEFSGDEPPDGDLSTSFYACSGCATGGPSSAIALTLAALALLLPHRRRAGRELRGARPRH